MVLLQAETEMVKEMSEPMKVPVDERASNGIAVDASAEPSEPLESTVRLYSPPTGGPQTQHETPLLSPSRQATPHTAHSVLGHSVLGPAGRTPWFFR
jgi:hypothetical protein